MKKLFILSVAIIINIIFFIQGINAAKLNETDLKKKKEGWYPTGLPLVNYSSDDGMGYGLRVYMYNNGKRDDKYFDSAPYFLQIYAQYFSTTNGRQYHELNLDMPYLAKSKFRLKSSFAYDKDLNANYFGIGKDASDGKLTNIITGEEYCTYDDYESKFLKKEDFKYYKFNKYKITKPTYNLYLYRNIFDFIRILAGYEINKATIETYDGKAFDYKENIFGSSDKYTASETLLQNEKPLGYEGGWTNFARFGIEFDTRDFEPDPNKGIYIDYAYEIAHKSLGSDYNFSRHTGAFRFYFTVMDSLVFALRTAYTDSSGDIPFYEMNQFGFALTRQHGLGGNWTLRGYKKYRFVGKTMTLGNAELRWEFAEINVAKQRFAFQLVGLYDTGNVYDKADEPLKEPRWSEYKNSYGGGLVITWNLSTVIHTYYAVSSEDSGLFINFTHIF